MIKKINFGLIICWLGWTALIDFAVVPTVFGTINDFFNAGELGIALFSKLNYLEVIVSSSLIALSCLELKRAQTGKLQLGLLVLAWTIVMSYFIFLTPKLTSLTELWKKADGLGLIGMSGIEDVQQEHQFYHRIYVGLDTVKILLLATLTGLEIFRQEKKVV